MSHDVRKLEMDIATTREVAERLSAALDHELASQTVRARESGASATLAEVEADLADATHRLKDVRAKGHDVAQLALAALDRHDFDAFRSLVIVNEPDTESLRGEAEQIIAEIAELNALRAELLRRPAEDGVAVDAEGP